MSYFLFLGAKLFPLVILLLGCCQAWKKTEARIATLEFDHDRKSMGVIVNSESGKKSLLVKVHSPLSPMSLIWSCDC